MPYFLETAASIAGARIEILRTLASYAARSRPNLLLAAHTIALGITTLDALHEAGTIAMSDSMRLRYRGNANSLNRAMLQTEKSLQARLAAESVPEPVPVEPVRDEPLQTDPAQAATPGPDTEQDAATSQPVPHLAPATAETASAAVMDALRIMGLAPSPSAIPTQRRSTQPKRSPNPG